ncbi:12012_t:CDS:2 [Entrophospora sp. SA101]|nr:11863_t:CDS:2 [Entrophospora sp. SA101]CAJ0749809.1 3147_t:CDS:2 [Entrophospora sp. SA101]CAJ0753413.1 12012_t:CDS:2 [Entrophospora sp. SA101]CAJ0906928.1 169_t:CDS:2 [Entrophospora sp. SA101]
MWSISPLTSLLLSNSSASSLFFSDLQACLEDLNDHCKISKSNNSYGAYKHIQLLSLSQAWGNYFFHNGKLPDHQPDNLNEFLEIETI